jgi:hypothetical protein
VGGVLQADLAEEFIGKYKLNTDQAAAVRYAADLMNKDNCPPQSVLLIHGQYVCTFVDRSVVTRMLLEKSPLTGIQTENMIYVPRQN